ncbi:hypothetical protein L596_010304 [Steinernema carpocapsae]|uniref:Uncharacterized protein n=1 Tax=Steinernema carpocapsae TaxID=34508 RepID=A0A4U5PIH4_STECR|nr:hypothetical protein L596_010304 [Steinernema carpocapsae]
MSGREHPPPNMADILRLIAKRREGRRLAAMKNIQPEEKSPEKRPEASSTPERKPNNELSTMGPKSSAIPPTTATRKRVHRAPHADLPVYPPKKIRLNPKIRRSSPAEQTAKKPAKK